MLQGIALELLRGKLAEASDIDEAMLRQVNEAQLAGLIVELGGATDEAQARAAVARAR